MDTRPAPRPSGREEKVALARRWQSSGQTQEQFCREQGFGISPRTLRGYLRLVPRARWDRQLRDAVARAVEALTEIRKALDQQEATPAPSPAPVPALPQTVPAQTVPAQTVPVQKAAAAKVGFTGHPVGFVFPRGR